MAGIVGIELPRRHRLVASGLDSIRHRGGDVTIQSTESATLGSMGPAQSEPVSHKTMRTSVVYDGTGSNCRDLASGPGGLRTALPELLRQRGPKCLRGLDGGFALAAADEDGLFLARDAVGIVPLYVGDRDGALCFASEVKGLYGRAENIREFPPGHCYSAEAGFRPFKSIKPAPSASGPADAMAAALLVRLSAVVARKLTLSPGLGCWLSGGLDSAAITAVTRQQKDQLHTFSIGVEGAPDLAFAQTTAAFLDTAHHEFIVDLSDLLAVLPEVIYHLESFDASLVRSSLVNYLLARQSADYVPAVLSGEGGDELFAGYHYLKDLDEDDLALELVDITRQLHNTALQRVDRCSRAHALEAYVPFVNAQVLDYALTIPTDYKIRRKGDAVEKWILRRAVNGLLPEDVVNRPKVKFWEGAGVAELLSRHADSEITAAEFERERDLPDGSHLATREEMMYYRIFRDHFSQLSDISFVGRTRPAAPAQ